MSGGESRRRGRCCGDAVRVDGGATGAGAQEMAGARLPVEKHAQPLTEQERVLHALNRLTFGPRPGDVAAVRVDGFAAVVRDGSCIRRGIDDSAFEARDGSVSGDEVVAEELKERFPSRQMIRQMGRRGDAVPSDPVERAIYADAEAVYRARRRRTRRLGVAQLERRAAAWMPASGLRQNDARTDGAMHG